MAKKRILLVDDEAIVTRTLKLYLEATGAYEVRTENHGRQAVATARNFEPDLIMLDLIMPDTDGATIASELKADALLKSVPIVFLTALVSRKEVGHEGKDIGGHPFLAKPVDPEKIIECIERQLSPKAQ
ncbi:MAG: response regulator [Gemmatimonadales bacterium]|nr:response regulator [Gemmatimonadales bacterium]